MILFEEVMAYIADYDPEFPDSIEAATKGDILELEALTGRELPEVYRNFLDVMGRNTGWLNIQNLDFRIGTVLEYYRRDNALPVDEFFRIGSDTKDPSYNPHLQMSLVAPELKVVAFPGCTLGTFAETTARHMKWIAGSMQEMFSRPAFRIYEIFGPWREPVVIRVDKSQSGQIDRLESMLLGEYALEPEFWSSSQVRGYKSSEMAVEAAQLGGQPLEIHLRANDLDKQRSIARTLATKFEAQVSAPSAT